MVVSACSGSGDEGRDLAEALDEGGDLAEATEALFGDRAPPGGQPDERAAEVADRIAVSVRAIDRPLDGGSADRYEDEVGAPMTDQVGHVGAVLGHTRARLADVDRGQALAYALRLGWDLGDRLADPEDRQDWVVPASVPFDLGDYDDLADHLEAGDDAAAARLVAAADDDLEAVDVIDGIVAELAEVIPTDADHDLVTTLLTRYDSASEPSDP